MGWDSLFPPMWISGGQVPNIDLGGAFGVAQQTFARPRWFGASLRYDF